MLKLCFQHNLITSSFFTWYIFCLYRLSSQVLPCADCADYGLEQIQHLLLFSTEMLWNPEAGNIFLYLDKLSEQFLSFIIGSIPTSVSDSVELNCHLISLDINFLNFWSWGRPTFYEICLLNKNQVIIKLLHFVMVFSETRRYLCNSHT